MARKDKPISTAYIYFNNNGKIVRIHQIAKINDNGNLLYSFSIEKEYDNYFMSCITYPSWDETSKEENLNVAREILISEFPNAIETSFDITTFSFLGDTEKIELVKSEIEKFVNEKFPEIKMYQNFNFDFIK